MPGEVLDDDILNEAVNEFIDSQKLRDRKLYYKYNENDEVPELVPRPLPVKHLDEVK